MRKKLSEMTLKELWRLFPIFLVEHDHKWLICYKEIETLLKRILNGYDIKRISHIGSTAINGIWSKNIIDVLIEIDIDANIKEVAQVIQNNGFIKMSSKDKRISFNKGYTDSGFADKVYHIHLRYMGDNDELYFRDYMNEYPQIAKQYESLKLKLWKKYEYDRDAYTNAKTDFIIKWTTKAREIYGDRY